jgi:hypothetical protein
MTIFWGLLFLVCSLLGLYIMATTPLAKKYKSSQYLDIGSGAFLIFIALVYFMVAHVLPSEDDNTEPCSRNSPQAICYGLDSEVCSEAWKSFDVACDEEVREIREKRPSALLHAVIYKCHAQKFDKITFYNRRKTDSPFCQQYFKKIE